MLLLRMYPWLPQNWCLSYRRSFYYLINVESKNYMLHHVTPHVTVHVTLKFLYFMIYPYKLQHVTPTF
jgi:hypothetical protein